MTSGGGKEKCGGGRVELDGGLGAGREGAARGTRGRVRSPERGKPEIGGGHRPAVQGVSFWVCRRLRGLEGFWFLGGYKDCAPTALP